MANKDTMRSQFWPLLMYSPGKRLLIRRGLLVNGILFPLCLWLPTVVGTSDPPLTTLEWVGVSAAFCFFLCCLLFGACFVLSLIVLAYDHESPWPYILVEWGLGSFWVWLLPLAVCYLTFSWATGGGGRDRVA